MTAADDALAPRLTDDLVAAACAGIPDEWLADEPGFAEPAAVRAAYQEWFAARLDAGPSWLAALRDAVAAGPAPPREPRRRNRLPWLGDGP